MRIKLFGFYLTVDYSFFLMLSFAVLLGAENIIDLLIYSALHESGHFFVLLICGGKPDSLKLSYYGLALKYSTPLSKTKECLVLLAGPLVNLVLYLLLKNEINLLLFVLNMLPVYPIDFGRVIRLFSYRLSKVLGCITLALLIPLAVYMLVVYKSFSLIFIVCYLIIYSFNY